MRPEHSSNTPPPLTGGVAIFYSVVMGLVLFMGSGAFISGIRLLLDGAPNKAGAITAVLMGALLTGLAIWFFYWSFVSGPIQAARLARLRKLYPDQPWMERSDWSSRRLSSSSRTTAMLMWVWVAGWFGGIGLIAFVNRAKVDAALRESWWNVAAGGFIAAIGLVAVWLAVAFTRKAMRYGASQLTLDTLPAFIGEKFVGTLTARLIPPPRNALSIELLCQDVEWVRIGYGDNRRTELRVSPLGSVTATADVARFFVSKDGMKGPVEIDVPTGLPESSRDISGNGIKWWLRIATIGDDAPFSCEFEVPVYERRT